MRKQLIIISVFIIAMTSTFISCKKFLSEKPDKQLVIPKSLQDLEALLDNQSMNGTSGLGEASADNYYLRYEDWAALPNVKDQNIYTWGDEIAFDNYPNGWSAPYEIIYNANLILESLQTIPRTVSNSAQWDNVKGSAILHRGRSYHELAINFCNAYDHVSQNDLGVPLCLTTDFEKKVLRSTLQQTYEQIISDLQSAVPLLHITPKHVLRPSKAAAYGFLARVYLSMREYEKAMLYADSTLIITNTLIDYNTLDPQESYPFKRYNEETIFHLTGGQQVTSNLIARVDTILYQSYEDNDLRKQLFFEDFGDNTYRFRGSYDNGMIAFTGITTAELLLTKAESLARKGSFEDALNCLSNLLIKRYKTGTFIAVAITNTTEVLQFILNERRKEFVFRDLRWMDIKRLNKEGVGISLTRILNSDVYALNANSSHFALPVPAYVIEMGGLEQNPRQ